MFAAVATATGPAYYVRLAPEVADSLRPGEAVRVGVDVEPWLKPADRIIARVAQENGGIYDPTRHQRALENLNRQSREGGNRRPPSESRRICDDLKGSHGIASRPACRTAAGRFRAISWANWRPARRVTRSTEFTLNVPPSPHARPLGNKRATLPRSALPSASGSRRSSAWPTSTTRRRLRDVWSPARRQRPDTNTSGSSTRETSDSRSSRNLPRRNDCSDASCPCPVIVSNAF